MINAAFARTFLQGREAVGEVIGLGACPDNPVTILGVAADSTGSPREASSPMLFRTMPRQDRFSQVFAVRTSGDSQLLVPVVQKVIASLVAAVAALMPALHALRVDAVTALRYE